MTGHPEMINPAGHIAPVPCRVRALLGGELPDRPPAPYSTADA